MSEATEISCEAHAFLDVYFPRWCYKVLYAAVHVEPLAFDGSGLGLAEDFIIELKFWNRLPGGNDNGIETCESSASGKVRPGFRAYAQLKRKCNSIRSE